MQVIPTKNLALANGGSVAGTTLNLLTIGVSTYFGQEMTTGINKSRKDADDARMRREEAAYVADVMRQALEQETWRKQR